MLFPYKSHRRKGRKLRKKESMKLFIFWINLFPNQGWWKKMLLFLSSNLKTFFFSFFKIVFFGLLISIKTLSNFSYSLFSEGLSIDSVNFLQLQENYLHRPRRSHMPKETPIKSNREISISSFSSYFLHARPPLQTWTLSDSCVSCSVFLCRGSL